MQDLRGGGHAFFEVRVSEYFAMAFLTLFRTISVKIALRIERGPDPPGRHRLSRSPHAHYVHPDFPLSLRFSRSPS